VGRGLGFGLNLLLSRSLGPSGLGLFSLVLTTCQTFELTARGGVDYGLSCALTGTEAERSAEERASVAASALQLVHLSTLVLGALLLIWVLPFQGLLPAELPLSRGSAALALVLIASLESLGGLPWDLLMIFGKTRLVALRQGLFAPLKLLAALLGAAPGGAAGALLGYALMSGGQVAWLQRQCRTLLPWPRRQLPHWQEAWSLICSGAPLYGTNALASLVFLPLLAGVAQGTGIAEVGYLRVGQIVVQLFTLLPGSLTPLLFLRLRQTSCETSRTQSSELSLRLIWWLGLTALLLYLLVDRQLVTLVFGESFLPSLQPTRLLVLMAVLDSVNQVLHTPLLASRRTGLFTISQNSGAVAAAALGWWLIPSMGLQGFLAAKLCFSTLPVAIYLLEAWPRFSQPRMVALLLLGTCAIAPLCWWPDAASGWPGLLAILVAAVLVLEGRPLLQLLPGR
jgi:O-antigen/teichoic acid export membrane protein